MGHSAYLSIILIVLISVIDNISSQEGEYLDELQYSNGKSIDDQLCLDPLSGYLIRGTYCKYRYSCQYKVELAGLCSTFKKCCLEYFEG